MNRVIRRQADIEGTKNRIFHLITQCIADIRDTVESSDLSMHDVGLKIEMYETNSGSTHVELNLHR